MNTGDLRQHLAAGGIAVFDLSSRSMFQLTGTDRIRYLNGQVSNDVRSLASNHGKAIPACVMTAKGKMNALVWISAAGDSLYLDADPELRESLGARLERYIISDDVTLADVTDEVSLFHAIGVPQNEPDPTAASHQYPTPPSPIASSRRFGLEGFDFLIPAAAPFVIPGSMQVDAETAETFRIEQGIPRWGAELNEDTIPVEAGLSDTAIDYHKGCYLGQEVISRIKSVGHVNRRLCGFVADTPLEAGMTLRHGAKEAGVLTSAAWSFALDKAVALGYLKRGIEETALTAQSAAAGSKADAPLIPVTVRTVPLIV